MQIYLDHKNDCTKEKDYGGEKWLTLKKCTSARQLIVVVYTTRTEETAKARLPKEPDLKR
jgi:hypothetical protein